MKFYFFIILHLIISVNLIGKNYFKINDSIKIHSKVSVLILPVVFKSIETKWAIGLSGSVSFKTTIAEDSSTRTSSVQAIAMHTQRKQNVQLIDATVYFPKEKYILYVQTFHSFFPDKFWGLGSNTINKNYENYEYNQLYFISHLKRKIQKNLFVGVIYEIQNVYDLKYKKNYLFDNSMIYGKGDHVVTGIGASITYDTRNSGFWPTKGFFVQYTYRSAVKSFLNSSYTNVKTILDVRYFKKINNKSIMAIQLFNLSNFHETPIRELAMLGGANNLRGFYQGRYRDLKMTTLIGECRFSVYKKFSACLFNGIGYVYNNLGNFSMEKIKVSYGVGLRYAITKNEKLNIRIDYGFADRYNKGLYFTLGECF